MILILKLFFLVEISHISQPIFNVEPHVSVTRTSSECDHIRNQGQDDLEKSKEENIDVFQNSNISFSIFNDNRTEVKSPSDLIANCADFSEGESEDEENREKKVTRSSNLLERVYQGK